MRPVQEELGVEEMRFHLLGKMFRCGVGCETAYYDTFTIAHDGLMGRFTLCHVNPSRTFLYMILPCSFEHVHLSHERWPRAQAHYLK